jgi:hypothetical protein
MKEYMEEEGERKLTGRCRLGRKQHDGVVTEVGSSRSGHGRQRPWVREMVDSGSTLGRRPPGLPPCLKLPFMRLCLAGEARSWHAVCPRGAPRIGQPPSGPC